MEISVIKEICNACWLNQAELAAFTGIKLQRIKDISSGRVDGFKRDDIAVLVEKLHLNPEWLTTGEGEVFKEGYGRSSPSKWQFVSDVIDRMVRIVDKDSYAPIYDDVLGLPSGTVNKWTKDEKIPYWFLKKFASDHSVSIDMLIYGFSSDEFKCQESDQPKALVTGSGVDKSIKVNGDNSMTMRMASAASATGGSSGNEVDEFILSSCLRACIKVYGDEFDTSPAAVQMGYAVDLYNLLVRMSDAMGDSLDKMRRLESDGFAQQLQLFIKLHKARKFPPNKNEAYMF